jgi:hypothetical protein
MTGRSQGGGGGGGGVKTTANNALAPFHERGGIKFVTVVILEICWQNHASAVFFIRRRVWDVGVKFTFCTDIHQFGAVCGFTLSVVHQGFS